MKNIARTILGIVAGYAVVVLMTELGFGAFPDGRAPKNGGVTVTALATMVAVAAGFTGGYVAAALSRLRPVVSAAIVTVPLVIESIWLLTTRTPPAEFWFEFFGAITLIGSTIAGGLARQCWLRRYRAA
ncbi:MAG TPA: hypothetical protein VMS98_10740 [Thermoanaerobaculia bacterium]|nr:hypothetical protein [Thermoanaerobaculia bacterium]